ncbi:MAG: macro domain-containing protein [Candidatus Paceibacterota bacterium]
MSIEIVQGDITKQPGVEAVVNAANTRLAPGGGVARAIHKVAGPKLYEEAKELAPIKPGQCVITGAYGLPNEYVIHCLGPRYGIDKPEAKILSNCYKGIISLALNKGLSSVASPAISTGAFGYPVEEAATVSVSSVIEALKEADSPETFRFVLFDSYDLRAFNEAFEKVQKV